MTKCPKLLPYNNLFLGGQMRNDRLQEFINGLVNIVGKNSVLTKEADTRLYREGIRLGSGKASAVIFPNTLFQFWDILKLCVKYDKVIIIQAANTGLTGGSTPDGDSYDRDVIIINTLLLDRITILNGGKQVLAFPGATLISLEEILNQYGREPHSLIGSSCIGASIIGGICNNSGGNLVNRGPAFTQLSLYAKVNKNGHLVLVNNLGIDLGNDPSEILSNLENSRFSKDELPHTLLCASDKEYTNRVRNVDSNIPARYNADVRRLYDASGCAGKIAVFAVRLDTFQKPNNSKVFLVGTNNMSDFTNIRKKILKNFRALPDMAEYMHSSFFDGANEYGKDSFLIIKYFGQNFIPKLLRAKRFVERTIISKFTLKKNLLDIILHKHAELFPPHLPERIREYRSRYEHLLIIKASDDVIYETRELLRSELNVKKSHDFFECNREEGEDILLHRYVAGIAPKRYSIVNNISTKYLLPLDVALPRNCENWDSILPDVVYENSKKVFRMGHFLCMVFHWDIVLKEGADIKRIKNAIMTALDNAGAKYPAEHNVGHLYQAETDLANFYKKIDPTNTFNAGVGKMSKKKHYNQMNLK